MVLAAGPGRSWPASGHSSCILRDRVPSDTGPSDPDTTEADTGAIGTEYICWADMDPAEVCGPDPVQPDADLEDTGSSDSDFTFGEPADDGSAARDTDHSQTDTGTVDRTDPGDGSGSE